MLPTHLSSLRTNGWFLGHFFWQDQIRETTYPKRTTVLKLRGCRMPVPGYTGHCSEHPEIIVKAVPWGTLLWVPGTWVPTRW